MARGNSWSSHEDALLTRFWRRNLTDSEIARFLPSRTPSAIRSRAHVLGLGERQLNNAGAPRGPIWTDERKARVRELFEAGHSDADIAAMLDVPVTRNAVIGARARMGLKRGGEITVSQRGRPRAAVRESSPHQQSAPPAPPQPCEQIAAKDARAAAAAKRLVPLRDLEHTACCWPIGDPQRSPFGFCGEKKFPGLPYCKEHALKAYADPDMALKRAEKAAREQVKVQRVKEGAL